MNPKELTLHPAIQSQPGYSDDDPRFLALADDVADRGIIERIKITKDKQIVDGRHRWRAALKAKLNSVPVEIVPDDQVEDLILRTLLLRRHYTKGQLAYLVCPLMDSAFELARKRMLSGVKPNPSDSIGRVPKTIDDWARQLGVHPDTIRQARQIHEAFAAHPDWKTEDEPKILDPDDPVGLGRIIAGFGGRKSTKDKPKVENSTKRQLDLFSDVFTDLGNRFSYWQNFDYREKRAAIAPLQSTIEKMPDDLLKEFEVTVKREIKRRQAEAK